tara:strand:+ start:2005 stop:2505 length:501 start_codon:yes stop_codon:yes gene_type:complete
MKYLIKSFVLIFISCYLCLGHTSDKSVTWILDEKGCKVANVFPQEDETITWTGKCDNYLANGQGKLTWKIKGKVTNVYEGNMVKGWAEGKGTLTRETGVYKGEWKQSLQHGKGHYKHYDGSWYDGYWKEGHPHGHGQMLTPDGRLISGTWYDGVYEDEKKATDDLT